MLVVWKRWRKEARRRATPRTRLATDHHAPSGLPDLSTHWQDHGPRPAGSLRARARSSPRERARIAHVLPAGRVLAVARGRSPNRLWLRIPQLGMANSRRERWHTESALPFRFCPCVLAPPGDRPRHRSAPRELFLLPIPGLTKLIWLTDNRTEIMSSGHCRIVRCLDRRSRPATVRDPGH